MAITKEYLEAEKERNTGVQRGELSIRDIDPDIVEKYNIKVGQLTPWTNLRIVD